MFCDKQGEQIHRPVEVVALQWITQNTAITVRGKEQKERMTNFMKLGIKNKIKSEVSGAGQIFSYRA